MPGGLGRIFQKKKLKREKVKNLWVWIFLDAFYCGKCNLLRSVVGEPSVLAFPAVKVPALLYISLTRMKELLLSSGQVTAQQIAGSAMFGTVENMREPPQQQV
jgi:hypothetical protein